MLLDRISVLRLFEPRLPSWIKQDDNTVSRAKGDEPLDGVDTRRRIHTC